MPKKACYASPKIAENIRQTFGKKTSSIQIEMRVNRDVSKFITRVEEGSKKTAENSLAFG
jgi:hypothetical protein